jgi:predicted phosphodiesterase
MRYGVLSDIHGNLPALERAIALLERSGVDRYLCLGDIVGHGPFPSACVARIAGLPLDPSQATMT